MPFELKLPGPPAGYAMKAARKGDQVPVMVRGFVSADDGSVFVTFLDGLPSQILGLLPRSASPSPSSVDHLVALIAKDGHAKVYLNEVKFILKARVKRAVQAGQPVTSDDVADIESLELAGISPDENEGFLLVFSVGWRKALFFDLAPLSPSGEPRSYDLPRVLGSYYAYLAKQHLLRITDEEWQTMLDQGWFPFVSLPDSIVEKLVSLVRDGYHGDDIIDEVVVAVNDLLDRFIERWTSQPCIEPHMALLEHAASRYRDRDYISASAVLYPRIEGVMRQTHAASGSTAPPKQNILVSTVLDSAPAELARYSFLLPNRFRQYLEDVYFADFKPGQEARLSRHSIAHGVADPSKFNAKAASVALLTLDQIFFFLPGTKGS